MGNRKPRGMDLYFLLYIIRVLFETSFENGENDDLLQSTLDNGFLSNVINADSPTGGGKGLKVLYETIKGSEDYLGSECKYNLFDGKTATLYTLVNDRGMTVEITDFGGTIVSIKTPDRNGKLTDVCLGYDSLSDYENADGYLGALVGRVANRIAGSSFELNGETYNLYTIDGGNCLHGISQKGSMV